MKRANCVAWPLCLVFALCAIGIAAIGAIGTAASAADGDPVPYVGVKGQPACPVDSNADKINRAMPLDQDTPNVWPVECANCISHALQIMDPQVVGDVLADGTLEGPGKPEWNLRHLLEQIGGSRGGGSALGDVLNSMTVQQTINSFEVKPRPDLKTFVIDPWAKAAGAADFADLILRLDGNVGASPAEKEDNAKRAWSAAPYKLLAIGYRPDLVRLDFEQNRITSGGEARFVFQNISQGVFQAQTLIFEYKLPAANVTELRNWTKEYDALRKLSFGPAFNAKLLEITKKFTDRNVEYPVPNNVTLGQLRTNELFRAGVGFDWELREFHISQRGLLEPSTVQMNPDLQFNTEPEDQTLKDYLSSDEFKKSFPHTTIPWNFAKKRFLAGSAINPVAFINTKFSPGGNIQPVPADKVDTWLPNLPDKDKRHRFAASTCNGCHGGDAPRTTVFAGKEAVLIPGGFFLTGFTHIDGRGGRIGHPGTAIMSDFMCSSDLVARASAFEFFLKAPDPFFASLFQVTREVQKSDFRTDLHKTLGLIGQAEKDAVDPSGPSLESLAAGMATIVVNQSRVH
jgi:hypothetical protein